MLTTDTHTNEPLKVGFLGSGNFETCLHQNPNVECLSIYQIHNFENLTPRHYFFYHICVRESKIWYFQGFFCSEISENLGILKQSLQKFQKI